MLDVKALKLNLGARCLVPNLSFVARPGERWAILGPNGCGKSTLLATLGGVLPLRSGTVLLQNKPLVQWSVRELARWRAFVLQTEHDAFSLPAIDRVLAARYALGSGLGWETTDDYAVADFWMACFDLRAQKIQDVLTLSGGERQRVSLAAAFAQEARLMLFDEPTTHLDLPHAIAFFELLATRTDVCALVVLHDVNLALRYCTHALLFCGDEVLTGTVQEVMTVEALGRAFAHPFRETWVEQQRWLLPV